jgi:DNA-binding NtrC family response regulator
MNTLLVVDDEAHIRYLYQIFFVQEGYHVLEAPSADAANEILKNEPVDIVLLDIRMPRANGGTLYDVIGLFHQKVKVIVSSVYPIEQQKKFVTGALDYFDKSQGLLALLTKIKAAAGKE